MANLKLLGCADRRAPGQPGMVVFAGKVGAPSLQIRCGIDELAASFVESGAVGYGGLEVDDLGGKLDAAALRREPVALARRCEDLLAEHEEHVAVLYSYRSVSKAIPYYAGEETTRKGATSLVGVKNSSERNIGSFSMSSGAAMRSR